MHPETEIEPHLEIQTEIEPWRQTEQHRERHAHRDGHRSGIQVRGGRKMEYSAHLRPDHCWANPLPFSLQTGRLRPRKGVGLAPGSTVYGYYYSFGWPRI